MKNSLKRNKCIGIIVIWIEKVEYKTDKYVVIKLKNVSILFKIQNGIGSINR